MNISCDNASSDNFPTETTATVTNLEIKRTNKQSFINEKLIIEGVESVAASEKFILASNLENANQTPTTMLALPRSSKLTPPANNDGHLDDVNLIYCDKSTTKIEATGSDPPTLSFQSTLKTTAVIEVDTCDKDVANLHQSSRQVAELRISELNPHQHLHHQVQESFDNSAFPLVNDVLSTIGHITSDKNTSEEKNVAVLTTMSSSKSNLLLSSSVGQLSHAVSDSILDASLRHYNNNNTSNNSNIQNVFENKSVSDISSSTNVSENNQIIEIETTPTALIMPRRVSFPKSDHELVTGYLEPANPWEHVLMVNSISEIAELYIASCQKHFSKPLQAILDHLKIIELNKTLRQPTLSLKSIKLAPSDCEALEELFKRIQYKSIDVSKCELNETAASALFEMFEYYEATNELDISSNSSGMTLRGWTSCTYMISHSRALQSLNAQGNPLSKTSAENLGLALNTSNLHTIKLEHCGLKGSPLSGLCFKLRLNRTLKELWLAHNDLDYYDADTIAELLTVNHHLELIDISNNNIKDEGLRKIVKALIVQSAELNRHIESLVKSSEVDDDSICGVPSLAILSLPAQQNSTTCNSTNDNDNEILNVGGNTSGDSDASPNEDTDDDGENTGSETNVSSKYSLVKTTAGTMDDMDDEDTEDTVKTVKNSQICGQSMLDKLLTMNSDSSSEEAPTNLSTDTIAACCSEDISISDDIFDIGISNKVLSALEQSKTTDCTIEATKKEKEKMVEIFSHDVEKFEGSLNNNINTSTQETVKKQTSDIFEVTAKESYYISSSNVRVECTKNQLQPTKVVDVNKNSKLDDFDDSHSTDSAFESASEGDISRHLPDEFSRMSAFESTRIDDNKETIETATIAIESAEYPNEVGITAVTPTSTSTPPTPPQVVTQIVNKTTPYPPSFAIRDVVEGEEDCLNLTIPPLPKVIVANTTNISDSFSARVEFRSSSNSTSPPLNAGGMRRTESSCMITQASRVRSHSSDSLSSDNSLDGSISSDNTVNFSNKINEKLTKNDTLTRQKQLDVPSETTKTPGGLKALALWNTNLTKDSGVFISDLLATTVSLELLNIGKNILSNDFVGTIKDSLSQNTTVTTLGLQSAHLSCAGIQTLSSILQFGGNCTLQRIDIRDNKLEVESLNILEEALKSNTTVTQIDIDDEPKRLSIGNDAQLDYARVLQNVRSMCSRNEKTEMHHADQANATSIRTRRGGYYMGSRKISLTCHTPRPVVETVNKLEVKTRKTGARLRSPIPSPPTISPSSSPVPSPSKSRFQVFRVTEVSPLTSPMTPSTSPTQTTKGTISAAIATPSTNNNFNPLKMQSISLPTSISVASMSAVTSSTQCIKRLSISPRSRFHVMKIYEDPRVPIAQRSLPPITNPISLEPPPMLRSSTVAEIAAEPAETPMTMLDTQLIVTTPISSCTGAASISNNYEIPSEDSKKLPSVLLETNSKSSISSDPLDSVKLHLSPSSTVASTTIFQIPVLEDKGNDITLTTNSLNTARNDAMLPVQISSSKQLDNSFTDLEVDDNCDSIDSAQRQLPPTSQRTRKVSWIQNSNYPATVDRLLSMFHNPGNLFNRSSSPEPSNLSSSQLSTDETHSNQQKQQLIPIRKRTPPSSQFPWCKLGTEMVKPVTSAIQTATTVQQAHPSASLMPSTIATTAPGIESSFSFLDAASKQLRDFSKQVFRQNLSFGNELNTNTIIPADATNYQHTSGCDLTSIPSDVKLQIKENISPEHTINEETLTCLQKLCIAGEKTGGAELLDGLKMTDAPTTVTTKPIASVPMVSPEMPTESSETVATVASEKQSCNS